MAVIHPQKVPWCRPPPTSSQSQPQAGSALTRPRVAKHGEAEDETVSVRRLREAAICHLRLFRRRMAGRVCPGTWRGRGGTEGRRCETVLRCADILFFILCESSKRCRLYFPMLRFSFGIFLLCALLSATTKCRENLAYFILSLFFFTFLFKLPHRRSQLHAEKCIIIFFLFQLFDSY